MSGLQFLPICIFLAVVPWAEAVSIIVQNLLFALFAVFRSCFDSLRQGLDYFFNISTCQLVLVFADEFLDLPLHLSIDKFFARLRIASNSFGSRLVQFPM